MISSKDGSSSSSSYSDLKREEGEHFLEILAKSGSRALTPLPGEASGQRVEKLPTGTVLTFDGMAATTTPFGLNRLFVEVEGKSLRAEAAGYKVWVPVYSFNDLNIDAVDALTREALVALGMFEPETLEIVYDWRCPR